MWAAAILILAWIFYRTPPEQVWGAVENTSAPPFIAIVVFFSLSTMVFDSYTHYWILNRFNPGIPFKDVFKSRGETYLLLSLGFLYGQGGMAYSVSKRSGQPLSEITGSILFLMLNSLITLLVFPTLALLFFVGEFGTEGFRNTEEWRVVTVWLWVSWPLIALHFIFWNRKWKHPLRKKLKDGAAQTFDRARWSDYAVVIGLRSVQAVNWCFFSWLALKAAGINLMFKSLLLFGPMVGLISAIPTPGRLGTTQAGWKLLFQSQADPAALVAFSLLWTLAINILRWFIGAIFLAFSGKDQKGPEEGA